MTAKTKFKSPAFEAIHSAAAGLYSVDAIAQETMRSFDETCISRVSDFQPGEIKALRPTQRQSAGFCPLSEHQRVHGPKWESGAKRPGGLALKLLNIVQKHGLEVLA
jgi:putative transcriptional regulator